MIIAEPKLAKMIIIVANVVKPLKKLIPLRFFTQSRPARSARLLRLHEFLEAPDHEEYLFAINVVAVTELLN